MPLEKKKWAQTGGFPLAVQMKAQMVEKWEPSIDHVKNCRTSAWIELFRPFALKTVVIPLPFPLVQRLTEDGIQVGSSAFPTAFENEWEVIDDQATVDWDEVEDESVSKGFCSGFEEFEASVKKGIEELGGVVVPKFTWSCPSDATFVSCEGNLKCRSVEEIFLLLQSSDLIVHDLYYAFDCCPLPGDKEDQESSSSNNNNNDNNNNNNDNNNDNNTDSEEKETLIEVEHSLVLKKWGNLRPGREMRCFVYLNQLKGICQRDPSVFYSFLLEEKEEIKESIIKFYNNNIHKKFPDPSFVMDVYVDRSLRVWLLDINPFAISTKTLMFEWKELRTPPQMYPKVQFRIVETQGNIQIVENMLNRVPLDVFDVGSAEGLQEFIKKCQEEEKNNEKKKEKAEGEEN